ncbi:MAG TPA: DUF4197 domain-containing protein [Burkholderiales bacterium]|nr:DUF4197 domain-containing protein [Burkholderiales bacterium]
MRKLAVLLLASLLAVPALAGLESLTNKDATGGLKAALDQGAQFAVSALGKENGFFGDPRVKIPLPDSLRKVEKPMRMMGMGKQFDQLDLSMNRAAEAAVPEAKALLTDAVKNMTVEDAKQILSGGDTAGTEYFKKHTEAALAKKFLPIVKQATDKVGLAQQYNSLAGQAKSFGLVKDDQATIEQYVTKKTLDGLYLMIGEEEKAIRKDPVGQSSALLKKVFGSLR